MIKPYFYITASLSKQSLRLISCSQNCCSWQQNEWWSLTFWRLFVVTAFRSFKSCHCAVIFKYSGILSESPKSKTTQMTKNTNMHLRDLRVQGAVNMITVKSLTRRVPPGPAESEHHMANRSDEALHLSARSHHTHLTQNNTNK